MTDTARPPGPWSAPVGAVRGGPVVGRGGEPATVPIPRPGSGRPGMRPVPLSRPGGPPGWPAGGPAGPPPAAVPPGGSRRPVLVAGVAVGAVLVLVLAALVLVRPGVLLPVTPPCEAVPGSTLTGFPDDVVGPNDITARVAATASSVPAGFRVCIYGTPGTGWNQGMPPGGRGLRVTTAPRVDAPAQPGAGTTRSTPSPGVTERQVVLPRSGVPAVVRTSTTENLTATQARCRTDTTNYLFHAAVSGTATDDVATLDALATALGCEAPPTS
ncbi:hypothetical protein [Actinomycetospora aeridis]|uniref:DUF5642 domain-containing protein n=1 Tax=Actinomycetospora aeridis TaxID=3129231 RepID=A0ABU8N6D0_9PSEU